MPNDEYAIAVYGLRDMKVSMRALPKEVRKNFNGELRGIAMKIVDETRARMTEEFSRVTDEERRQRSTGTAEKSVRAVVTASSVLIKAGGSSAPYYPWLDFGGTLWPKGKRRNRQNRPYVKGGRFLYPTVARMRPELYAEAIRAVERARALVFHR